MRILHVLHTSLPHIAGYTIRSSYILEHLGRLGCELAVVTSAQHPNGAMLFELVKGIPHWRTPNPRRVLPTPAKEVHSMWALRRRLAQVVPDWKPELIHAHSPMLVGLPALRAAKAAGIPLVYEVRDLWENASVDRGKFAPDSAPYRVARALETAVFQRAQAVVTIGESLKNEIAPRVRGSLHVVPNAVDTTSFAPRPKDPEVTRRWGLEGKKVVGYVGTFQPYEGLDTLIRAMPAVVERVGNAHLVITGAGGVEAELKQVTSQLGLSERVTFTGRVPHEQVLEIYAQIDVFAYPRISTRTTRITTPLKPLEAMALGKPVIVSDLPAMRELVRPGETGLVFRAGDSQDLARAILELLADEALAERIGAGGREQVNAERQWGTVVAKYLPIYEAARGVSKS